MPRAGTIIVGSFAFVRDNPVLVTVWSLIYIAISLLMSLISQPLLEAQMAMASGLPVVPEGFMSRIVLLYAAMIAMLVTLFAAAFRAVLQPERSRAAYLRFGMDELRLFGLMLIFLVGGIGILILWAIVLTLLIAAVIIITGANSAAVGLLTAALNAAIFASWCWAMVRFSAAGPLTVLRGKIVISEAWRLTRGHF